MLTYHLSFLSLLVFNVIKEYLLQEPAIQNICFRCIMSKRISNLSIYKNGKTFLIDLFLKFVELIDLNWLVRGETLILELCISIEQN